MAEPQRNISEEEELELLRLKKAKAQVKSGGIGVTPAKPQSPGERLDQRIQDLQPLVANAERRSQQQNPYPRGTDKIEMNPETGLSERRIYGPESFDVPKNAFAPWQENVDFSDPLTQRSAIALQGLTLGGAGELIGALGGEDAKSLTDSFIQQGRSERPVESFFLEAAPALGSGTVMGRGMATLGAGPRSIMATEGAVYGFNDPILGGEDFTARSANAAAGGVLGRVAGGAADSAVNVGKRLNNRLSGTQSIQDIARDDFGITLTEGQIKQDVGLQGFERDARKGAKGQDAADVAIQSFKDQERATLDAGRGLGGDRFATSNQAAGDFLSGVQGRVQTQQNEINKAYERARGFNAELNAQGARSMPDAVVSGLDNDLLQQIEIDPNGFKQLHPNTAAALNSVAALGRAGQQRGGLPFEQLETTRRIINNAISASAQNPADRRAAMQLKGSFDKFIDSAVDQKLFSGDDAFIGAYQEARGLRAEFAKDWEANKVFKKLIESDATPEMAINFVLGGGRLAGDNQMTVLRQLKTALKDDPETIAALQEAYIKKFMRQTEKTFNPKVLRDGLDELLIGKNQSFATELLDEDQYQQLRKFRAVVDSMIPMDGSVNTSNTGAMIERTRGAISDLLTGPMRSGPVRMTGRVLGEALGKVGVRTSGARARQQFNPPRGLDTRTIDSGLPPGSVAPSGQVPQGPTIPTAAAPSPAEAVAASRGDPVTRSSFPTLNNPTTGGAILGGMTGGSMAQDLDGDGRVSMQERYIQGTLGALGGGVGGRALDKLDNQMISQGSRQVLEGRASPMGAGSKGSLPMDEASRMARAREMGFDTDNVSYRGINGGYDPSKAGNYQMFTRSPEDAGEYGNNVVPAYLKKGRNLQVNGGGNNFNSVPVSQLPGEVRANLHPSTNSVARTDEIAYAAQKAGYDSVSINNVYDKASGEIPRKPAPRSSYDNQEIDQLLSDLGVSSADEFGPVTAAPEVPRNYDPTTVDIIFDPKNIRSKYATFDPAQSESPVLTAGIGRPSQRRQTQNVIRDGLKEAGGRSRAPVTRQPVNRPAAVRYKGKTVSGWNDHESALLELDEIFEGAPVPRDQVEFGFVGNDGKFVSRTDQGFLLDLLNNNQLTSAARPLAEKALKNGKPFSVTAEMITDGQPIAGLPEILQRTAAATTPIPGVKPSYRGDVTPAQARGQLRDDLISAGDDEAQVDQLLEILGDDVVQVLSDRQLGPAVSRGIDSNAGDGGEGLGILLGLLGAGGAATAIQMSMRDSGNTKATMQDVMRALDRASRQSRGLPPTPQIKPPLNLQ